MSGGLRGGVGHMVCSVFQVAAVHQRTVQQEAGAGEGKLLFDSSPSCTYRTCAQTCTDRQVSTLADRLLTGCFTSVGGASRRVFPSLLPNWISASVTDASRPSDVAVATVTAVLLFYSVKNGSRRVMWELSVTGRTLPPPPAGRKCCHAGLCQQSRLPSNPSTSPLGTAAVGSSPAAPLT